MADIDTAQATETATTDQAPHTHTPTGENALPAFDPALPKGTEIGAHAHSVPEHTHEQTLAEAEETKAPEEQKPAEETKAPENEAEEAPKAEESAAAPDTATMQQVLKAELRAAAALAGVPKEKIPYAVRLADLNAPEGADPAEYAEKQIGEILQDVPELRQTSASTGSAGEHVRKTTTTVEESVRRTFASGL